MTDFLISAHLKASEVACKCGCGHGMGKGEFSPVLASSFEALRTEVNHRFRGFGEPELPLIVHSGCRCTIHNRVMIPPGHPRSQHLRGCALDLHAPGVPHADLKVCAEEVEGLASGGIGLYSWGIHIDVGRRARW